MSKRPHKGNGLLRYSNSARLPLLDSLTIVQGQQLVSSTPMNTFASAREMITAQSVQQREAAYDREISLNRKVVSSSLEFFGKSVHFDRERTGELESLGQSFRLPKKIISPQRNRQMLRMNKTWDERYADDMMNIDKSNKQPVFHDVTNRFDQKRNSPRQMSRNDIPGFEDHRTIDAAVPLPLGVCPPSYSDLLYQKETETLSHSPTHNNDIETILQRPTNKSKIETLPQRSANFSTKWSRENTKIMSKNRPAVNNRFYSASTTTSTRSQTDSLAAPSQSPLKLPKLNQRRAQSIPPERSSNVQLKSKFKGVTSNQNAIKSQKSSKFKEKVVYQELLPVSRPEDHISDLKMVRKRPRRVKKERKQVRAHTDDINLSTEHLTKEPSVNRACHSEKKNEIEPSEDCDDFENDKCSEEYDVATISVSGLIPDLPALNLSGLDVNDQLAGRSVVVKSGLCQPKRVLKKRNIDLETEQQRQLLAEQRRQKQRNLYNKIQSQPWKLSQIDAKSSSGAIQLCDDYDFLSRYCILNPSNLETYRQVFEQADKYHRGWLSQEETGSALREVNSTLSKTDEDTLFWIIQLTGNTAANGVDFRLFSTLAALSQRISNLDYQIKLALSDMSYQLLEMKTFLCKRLWEVCVEPKSKCIPMDQLLVELRSGGISHTHEAEVINKLGRLASLDLLDFLIYSPLFFMIHQTIIENPLSNS